MTWMDGWCVQRFRTPSEIETCSKVIFYLSGLLDWTGPFHVRGWVENLDFLGDLFFCLSMTGTAATATVS